MGPSRCQRHHCRFHQIAEISKFHPHQFPMRTRVEGDFLVIRQRLVHENIHAVEIAERRHGSSFAIGETIAKLDPCRLSAISTAWMFSWTSLWRMTRKSPST